MSFRSACVTVWFSLMMVPVALGESLPTTTATTGSQSGSTQSLTKAERISKLRIRQAQLDLAQAKRELEEATLTLEGTRRLFKKRIVTIEEFRKHEQAVMRAELAYEKADIELEKTRLEFLKDATLITVVDAIKRRTSDGLYWVDVTVRNDSDLGKALIAMEEQHSDNSAPEDLAALLNIDSIIVTLIGRDVNRDEGEVITRVRSELAIVGDPYQQIIDVLKHGEIQKLTFQLLKKDINAVTVRLAYLGTKQEFPVFLKMEAAQDLPTIAASPFAQQGRLGQKVYYNLELERLATSERSFSPVVLNLPLSIPFAFLDPQSDARVTQIRFTPETSKQTLRFEVSIPEKLEKSLVDESLSFEIIITNPGELKRINEIKSKYLNTKVPVEEIQKIKGSRQSLILIPQGVGKLDTLIANSFLEIAQDEQPKFKFTIYNSGTLTLRRVTPEVDFPLEWEGEWTPRIADSIEPDEKILFIVDARPPDGVTIGEYTLKISCEAYSGVETVEAIDEDFTVRVVAKRNITSIAVLVGVLILLVLIIAVASIKISRR